MKLATLLLLLSALSIELISSGPLTPLENQYLQHYCGTRPTQTLIGRHKRFFPVPKPNYLYGGQPTSATTAPWSVKLHFYKGMCSGTLISQRHILTATHCLYSNPQKRAVLFQSMTPSCNGYHQVYTGRMEQVEVFGASGALITRDISQATLFNLCNRFDFLEHDVAILELSQNLPSYSDNLWPACIAQRAPVYSEYVYIASYGQRELEIDAESGDVILNSGYSQIAWISGKRFLIVYGPGLVTARKGDSGGGAMVEDNGRKTVIGVASNGFKFNAIYFAVPTYYPEICRLTGICRV